MNKTSHPDFLQQRAGVLVSSKIDEFANHRDRRSMGKKVIDLLSDVGDLRSRVAILEDRLNRQGEH